MQPMFVFHPQRHLLHAPRVVENLLIQKFLNSIGIVTHVSGTAQNYDKAIAQIKEKQVNGDIDRQWVVNSRGELLLGAMDYNHANQYISIENLTELADKNNITLAQILTLITHFHDPVYNQRRHTGEEATVLHFDLNGFRDDLKKIQGNADLQYFNKRLDELKSRHNNNPYFVWAIAYSISAHLAQINRTGGMIPVKYSNFTALGYSDVDTLAETYYHTEYRNVSDFIGSLMKHQDTAIALSKNCWTRFAESYLGSAIENAAILANTHLSILSSLHE